MLDFFVWGWGYVLAFLVVLGISYLLSVLVLCLTRHFFIKSSDLFVFSISVLFIVATLLSWALSIDLFVKIPYRPIEFIGQPFWIPNFILGAILVIFASKQVKKLKSNAELVPIPSIFITVMAWLLLVIAIILLIYTRATYYTQNWGGPVITFFAENLNRPQLCENINPYNGLRSICVLKSLNVASSTDTEECHYFAVQGSTDRVDCIVAKAVRNNTPKLCNEFLDEKTYGPMLSYETFKCMSNFVGTEEWSTLCKNIFSDYPDKVHFFNYANCSVSENLNDVQGKKSSNGMLSYRIKQPNLNAGLFVYIQYESIPQCDSFSSPNQFIIRFGDGQEERVDCKGVVEHKYASTGVYQVDYISNGSVVSSLTVELE
jgi:hypothetical protein